MVWMSQTGKELIYNELEGQEVVVRQFMSDQAVREEMVTSDDKGVCGRVKEM